MIAKGNFYKTAAAAAVGMVLAANSHALAETLCNEYTVKKMGIVQVNAAGQCLVFVSVASGGSGEIENRVVGDANGAVKLFASYALTAKLMAEAKFDADTIVLVKRSVKPEIVTTPSREIITLHKAAKKEVASFAPRVAAMYAETGLAFDLGWSVLPVGAAKREQYEAMENQSSSLNEVVDIAGANVTKYATMLTNAGISPVTYLQIVAPVVL